MKRIKSFKLFESVNPDIVEKVCSLYEDVRSIGYILEEEGFEPEYKITVVCVQKEVRTIRVRKSEEIRGFLRRSGFIQLRSFMVTIKDTNPKGLSRNESLDFLKQEVDRYLALLKEHLDYVPEEHIKMQLWRSNPSFYDISISADLFKK